MVEQFNHRALGAIYAIFRIRICPSILSFYIENGKINYGYILWVNVTNYCYIYYEFFRLERFKNEEISKTFLITF